MPAPESPKAQVRNDLRGAASFAFALVSAGLAVSALHLWGHLYWYQNDLPPLFPGGKVHTVNFYPWAASLSSIVTAYFAMRLLSRSLIACRAVQLPRLTVLHVGTGVLMLPLLFHLVYAAGQAVFR